MSRKSRSSKMEKAAPDPAAEEAAEVPPQDFGLKAASFCGYCNETLSPLLLTILTKLEESVEYFEGTVRRPADPRAWLSAHLHCDAYARENALLRDEIETLRVEAARLKEIAPPKPKPVEEAEEAEE